MAQGDYLPGTYSRVGTEENPGTYLGGDSGGTSQTMPPKVKKVLRFALSITTSSASSPTFQKLSAPYLSTRRF